MLLTVVLLITTAVIVIQVVAARPGVVRGARDRVVRVVHELRPVDATRAERWFRQAITDALAAAPTTARHCRVEIRFGEAVQPFVERLMPGLRDLAQAVAAGLDPPHECPEAVYVEARHDPALGPTEVQARVVTSRVDPTLALGRGGAGTVVNAMYTLVARTPTTPDLELGAGSGSTFGRQADRCLPAAAGTRHRISAVHARIEVDDDGAVSVLDLGSTNGTTVNGLPVVGRTPMRVGDELGMGTARWVLVEELSR